MASCSDLRGSTAASDTIHIQITAPRSLPEGYVFYARLEKEVFPVTVPEGGVKKGEAIYTVVPKEQAKPEKGRWKDGLFSCLRFGPFHPSVCNAWCCPHLLMAQLLARMRLTALADAASRGKSSGRTKRMIAFFVTMFIVESVLAPSVFDLEVGEEGSVSLNPSPGAIIWREIVYGILSIPFSVYTILVLVKLRAAVRTKYNIPTGGCGRAEDCCCILFCHCCTIAQLARQTAEYEHEPAYCCSRTGLSPSKNTDTCMIV